MLDTNHPNLQWRALVELVGRPEDSPAVLRARGGADAAEPLASMLAELQPDGTWVNCGEWWEQWSGPGWRLLAAAQWGANPSDPRLHAAVENLLAVVSGVGGFSAREGDSPSPWLTARILQALASLGWARNARFQEALAWLDEEAASEAGPGWSDGKRNCMVTPVALLAALTASGEDRRVDLRNRAETAIIRGLSTGENNDLGIGHPNFDRTDMCEALWALARADVDLDSGMVPALASLQAKQLDGGRWAREPASPENPLSGPEGPSRWVTLRAAVAVLHYAVEARLPRMYPKKPS